MAERRSNEVPVKDPTVVLQRCRTAGRMEAHVQFSLHRGPTMNIRAWVVLYGIAVLAAFAPASCGKPGVQAARENTDLTRQEVISIDDQSFLLEAEKAEVRQTTLAQAALDTSMNYAIRAYAQQVITNYRRALVELSDLTKAKNIPHTSATIEAIRLDAMNRLHGLSGSTFDHEFISLMTAEQQAAITTFDSAAETSADPDIRNYARGVVPLLREDFNTATALEKKLAAKELK
jgi:putative membrane protein